MYRIEFDREIFDEIIPWLMYNRDGLSVLVHADAEDAWQDHAWYPFWMGDKLDLELRLVSKREETEKPKHRFLPTDFTELRRA